MQLKCQLQSLWVESVNFYKYNRRKLEYACLHHFGQIFQRDSDLAKPRSTPESCSLVNARLVYDGHTNIYVTDWDNRAVHVWSVDGRYDRQLLSSPRRITSVEVDRQRHVMYVGQEGGIVSVYALQFVVTTV
jgi:hypothetical protein